eukprot:11143174-Heterocapsa_arctica.AAC.1
MKIYDFLYKTNTHHDYKAEWCKALGLNIENINGDGNCLYTCLGKDLELNTSEARSNIVEHANLYWNDTMDLIWMVKNPLTFVAETADRNEWEGPYSSPFLLAWPRLGLTFIVLTILSKPLSFTAMKMTATF